MFKWINFILSFRIKDSILEVFDEITFKSRKAIRLTLVAAASVLFICGGFFIALIDATQQFDQNGIVFMSSTFVSGILLALVSSSVFLWIFAIAWPGVARFHRKTPEDTLSRDSFATPPSNFEQAISALILDFVREREENRAKRASEHTENSPSKSEIPPQYSH